MKKYFKILGFVALAALVVGTFVFLWKKSRPIEVKYEIVTVTKGDIEKKAVATGKVEARNEIQIKPQIAGIIEEIYKEAGQAVKKNEIIARIKVIPDMVSLNSAQSRVNVANINLKQAETDFKRQKDLFEKEVISKEEYEKTTVSLKSAKEEYESAKDNLDLIKNGITKKSGAESNTLIRSTIDGMILNIPVKVGNSVIQTNSFNEGTTIATIANMNDMLFIGKVDETEVGKIRKGMPLKLSIGALNDRKFDANLEYISPKGTEESGAIMFEIKAAAKIPSNVFVRSGYSANAEVVLSSAKDVIMIPESVIEFNKDTATVQILKTKDPQTFVKRIITTGLSDGINIEVKSGLKKGEKLRGAAIDPKAKKKK
ncbi:MAG: efflux RND transporter periplasmic adaptor subunit [Bacteroidales bacterium]|nr:efflux RND transporter periplasmic adaptor subunit [Bacteroidales bacterium]